MEMLTNLSLDTKTNKTVLVLILIIILSLILKKITNSTTLTTFFEGLTYLSIFTAIFVLIYGGLKYNPPVKENQNVKEFINMNNIEEIKTTNSEIKIELEIPKEFVENS